MCRFYCDSRYGTKRELSQFVTEATITSAAGASTTEINGSRHTVLENVTVKDFTVNIGSTGDTGTSGSYVFVLGKSLAGTGAFTAIGTASFLATTGVANYGRVDGTVTTAAAANLLEGDDIVMGTGPGTALEAGDVKFVGYGVSFVERFIADQVT